MRFIRNIIFVALFMFLLLSAEPKVHAQKLGLDFRNGHGSDRRRRSDGGRRNSQSG